MARMRVLGATRLPTIVCLVDNIERHGKLIASLANRFDEQKTDLDKQ